MHSLSRKAVLVLIGLSLVLHTAEEYLTFPRYLSLPHRLPSWLPRPGLVHNGESMRIALVFATVLPLAVIAWAVLRPRKVLLIAVLLLEAILLVNAVWHILVALITNGYAPGVITAVLINLPLGIFVLRTAVKEHWIGARTAWQLIGIALLLHILALGSFLAG